MAKKNTVVTALALANEDNTIPPDAAENPRAVIGDNAEPVKTDEEIVASLGDSLATARSALAWGTVTEAKAAKDTSLSRQSIAYAVMVMQEGLANGRGMTANARLQAWRNTMVGPKALGKIHLLARDVFLGAPPQKATKADTDPTIVDAWEAYNANVEAVRRGVKLAIALGAQGVVSFDFDTDLHLFNLPVSSLLPSLGGVVWRLSFDRHGDATHIPLDGRMLYMATGMVDTLRTDHWKATPTFLTEVATHNHVPNKDDKRFAAKAETRAARTTETVNANAATTVNEDGTLNAETAAGIEAKQGERDALVADVRNAKLVLDTAPVASLLSHAIVASARFLKQEVIAEDNELTAIFNAIEGLISFRDVVRNRIEAQKRDALEAHTKAQKAKADRAAKDKAKADDIARIQQEEREKRDAAEKRAEAKNAAASKPAQIAKARKRRAA